LWFHDGIESKNRGFAAVPAGLLVLKLIVPPLNERDSESIAETLSE
jgi:hypothetical protein